MKANEFVKKFGIKEAKKVLHCMDDASEFKIYMPGDTWDKPTLIDAVSLRRLVESHELVAIHGFEKSKEIVANAPSDDHFYSWTLGDSGVRDKTVNIGELRKAIADVESCMEVS